MKFRLTRHVIPGAVTCSVPYRTISIFNHLVIFTSNLSLYRLLQAAIKTAG